MTSRPAWTGSIRFRLAAWYAAIVLAVIVALGFSFSALLERDLRSDVDARVLDTAKRVKDDFDVYLDPDTGRVAAVPPIPALYSFPSLLIQVVNADGEIFVSSESLLEERGGNYRILPVKAAPAGSAKPEYETVTLDGAEIRTVSLPLVLEGSNVTIGAVNVGEPLIQLEQTLGHVRRLLIGGAALGVAFAAVSGWFLAGRALRPVARITATAEAIAEGGGVERGLAARLEVGRSGDELARLSATFNRMLLRLQETFEAQRRFIADASHELRTPLTAIRGNVEVLSRQMARTGEQEPALAETMVDLRRESERMGRLVEDLLLLARTESFSGEEERFEPVRLDEVVVEAVRVGTALADGQQLEAPPAVAVTVRGNRDRLFQVLLILIDNALRHTAAGGTVSVRLAAEGTVARLSVQDTGSGIDPGHLPHLFERFYRADASRGRGSGGTGLGLAIARAIVERHGGTIAATSAPGAGTTMTVTLPMVPPTFE